MAERKAILRVTLVCTACSAGWQVDDPPEFALLPLHKCGQRAEFRGRYKVASVRG